MDRRDGTATTNPDLLQSRDEWGRENHPPLRATEVHRERGVLKPEKKRAGEKGGIAALFSGQPAVFPSEPSLYPLRALRQDGSEGFPEAGENLGRISELADPGNDETTNCANDTKEGGKSTHHGGHRGPQRRTDKPEEGGAGGKGGGHPLLRPTWVPPWIYLCALCVLSATGGQV